MWFSLEIAFQKKAQKRKNERENEQEAEKVLLAEQQNDGDKMLAKRGEQKKERKKAKKLNNVNIFEV